MPGRFTRTQSIAACSALALAAVMAAAQEPLAPLQGTSPDTAPPPMYVAEPFGGNGFVGMPAGITGDDLPRWPRWFAGANGLIMTRTLPSGTATMQPLRGTQLTTSSAAATWPGGVDLHLGRWFGPRQQHAVEVIYWGVYDLGSTAGAASTPPAIDAIPQAPGVTLSGQPASTFLTNAAGQQIGRSDVINDVEINWVYSLWERPEFLPRERTVNLMWLVGFRYFEVGDTLLLNSSTGNPSLGGLDLNVATNNNIYGAQVGAKFDWRMLPGLRFNVVPKFMIGGNSITNTTSLTGTSGTAATFTSDGSTASVHSTLGVFSWLGSVDTGVAWDVTDHWSLCVGYRVVGVGNIAQADGQWPSLITTPASLAGIEAGSSTIIHGGFAGFEGRY